MGVAVAAALEQVFATGMAYSLCVCVRSRRQTLTTISKFYQDKILNDPVLI
jgi:hypothetical protein